MLRLLVAGTAKGRQGQHALSPARKLFMDKGVHQKVHKFQKIVALYVSGTHDIFGFFHKHRGRARGRGLKNLSEGPPRPVFPHKAWEASDESQ